MVEEDPYWFSQEFISELLLRLPVHVFWKNTEGVFKGCNQAFAKSIGLSSPNDVIGKTDYDLPTTKEESDAYRTDDLAVIHSNKAKINIEETQTRRDGKKVTLLTSKVPLVNKQGCVVGVLCIYSDVTELKNAQHELLKAKEIAEAASQAKTEFIQNMQHDVRTPAAGVWALLSELTSQESDPKKKRVLSMLTESSARLLELCNAVVDFSYVDEQQKPVVENKIDIRRLAADILDLNKPAAYGKDLILHLKVDSIIPSYVLSDEFRLRRILINLIGNAVKFTKCGSISLEISAKREDKRHLLLCIKIKDTGIGIPEAKRHTIFEKFSRGTASDTNEYPGTGLGLYLVKKFVRDLDGDLELESVLGKGSQFKVILPCTVPLLEGYMHGLEIDETHVSPLKSIQELAIELPLASNTPLDTPFHQRVLLVEDDPVCLFAATEVLAHFTNQLDTARNVHEACMQLQQQPYDFVISDLGLPDGSGIDILGFAHQDEKSKNPHTPFIALTAHHQGTEKHKTALQAGFAEVVTKPLLHEQARHLFEVYAADSIVNATLDIIDLNLGMQRIGSKIPEKALVSIGMLLDSLKNEDLPQLKRAYKKNDLLSAREVLHKIRGALNCCGTPRFETSLEALHQAIKTHEDLHKITAQFETLYTEVELIADEYQKLKQSKTESLT